MRQSGSGLVTLGARLALSLIEAVTDVRRNPAMHESLEHLERTGDRRDWTIVVWIGAVSALEHWENSTDFPRRWDHAPLENEVVEAQDHVSPCRLGR